MSEINDLVERLSLQSQSFQEGFDVLSKSRNLKETSKHFMRILRGTLLSTELSINFFDDSIQKWTNLQASFKKEIDLERLMDSFQASGVKLVKINKEEFLLGITRLHNKGKLCVVLGSKFNKESYSDFDKITLQNLLQLFDNAYRTFLALQKEKELVFSLNSRILQLNSLIDAGIEISKLKKRRRLLDLTLERATSLINASEGYLKILKNKKTVSEFLFPKGTGKTILKNFETKIKTAFSFPPFEYELTLFNKESRNGIVEFDGTDQILLDALARQVHASMENAFLHNEALEKESIQKELSLAGAIQKKLLPETTPEIPGYDLAGINIPSKEVGGDYYQIKKLDDGRYALIIADVAGKGVPASLLVSTLDACLAAYLDVQIPLPEMAVKINKIIFNSSPPEKFITFFIAVLNPGSGELDIINAGHNPILLLKSNGEIKKIGAGGVAFGMFDMGLPFEGETLKMRKGERLFLYTDGIPEAMNRKEEEYSDERMEKFFKKNKPAKAETFINNVVKDVKKHAGNAPQSDDITALYLIRK
ncbi:MAG: PP2C family protein-serine/threonine phosphatase [Chlorobi bacterium]|nr:PP2C family protein-serine/threonine phosphatase [Chlorobiota bacterium]